jgi:DNA-directed RNA polymerase subunit RPC12/RpoP
MFKPIPNKVISWIVYNGLKHAGGDKYEWDVHRFMLDPIADLHPLQCHRKCAQIGFSESMIPKSIYLARVGGLNVCYTMPSAKDMDDFDKTKFGGIIRANPYLQGFVDGNSSKKIIKTLDNKERYIHLVGAYNSESSGKKEQTTRGISFTSDANIFDESDRSDSYVLDQLQSRLLNSDYKFNWWFSNPTYPHVGTDEKYQESDQRHYVVKCPHCGWRQYLDWYRTDKYKAVKSNHCYIDPDRMTVICGKCSKELDDNCRKRGEWISKYNNKEWHGYWYTQLMNIKQSVPEILRMEKSMSPSVFANMVLGKPYIGADVTITMQTILNNLRMRASEPQIGHVAMGIDVRIDELQYVLRDEQGMFEYGRVKDWNQIKYIRDRWDATAVIDLHPQTGEAKRFAKEHIGKVWYAVFTNESDQKETVKFGTATDYSMCHIRREEMFDVIADKYSIGDASHNMNASQVKEFGDEWTNIIRTIEEDSRGNPRPVWVKTGECDFPFADLYSWAAMLKVTGRSEVSKIVGTGIKIKKDNELTGAEVFQYAIK